MKNSLSIIWMLLILCLSFKTTAQISYPYNPDGNQSGTIGVGDLQDLLSTYGQTFSPGVILVDSIELSELLSSIQLQINALEEAVAESTSSIFEGVETPHGEFTFIADTIYVVPAGVHSIELTISGGQGGQGGSTVGPYNNNQNGCAFGNLSGGGGGPGGFFRGLLNVSAGDSLIFEIGANGTDGYTPSNWNANGTSGTDGTESVLLFGSETIITVTGGGGGGGQQCYTGYYNGQNGVGGSHGGLSLGQRFSQTGMITLETQPQSGAFARVRY